MAEDKQKDKETMTLLRKEYQMYKDQWGLNLKYSHEAGESKNYSKMFAHNTHLKCTISTSMSYMKYDFLKFSPAAKIPLMLQVVHISYGSTTFDKIEKDAKVNNKFWLVVR